MPDVIESDVPAQPLLDRGDERVKHEAGIGGAVQAFLGRVRSGDLGALPVVVGLLILWTVFQSLNSVFLSSTNLVNLLFDCSTVGVISLGIVCVLMVGEIDLSVGSVSGFASALLGVLWVNMGWPVGLAVVAAIAAGALIGAVYALLFNRFGMPSFVATLAGLLAVLGLQLYILGQGGSVNLPYGSALVNFGQLYCMPHVVAYVIAALAAIGLFASGYNTAARRKAAGLSSSSLGQLLLRAGVIVLALELIVAYLNRDRGVPWMFGLFAALVIIMTTRHSSNRSVARTLQAAPRVIQKPVRLLAVFAAKAGETLTVTQGAQ